ncbi:MAG: hypothetical protein ABH843_02765 [Candidatus Omnitrophota bacterium]
MEVKRDIKGLLFFLAVIIALVTMQWQIWLGDKLTIIHACYVLFLFGSFLFFRDIARYKVSTAFAFVSLAFSSAGVSYLKQHSSIISAFLIPWIALSALKYLRFKHPKFIFYIIIMIGVNIPCYYSIFSGAAVSANPPTADFLTLLTPYWFILHFIDSEYMSASFLYIGLIPLLFAVTGACLSKDRHRPAFIFAVLLIIFLMLAFHIYQIAILFIFCLTYFVCMGFDVIFDSVHKKRTGYYRTFLVLSIIIISAISISVNYSLFDSFFNTTDRYVVMGGLVIDFYSIAVGAVSASNLNILLFIAGSIIILYVLRQEKMNLRLKYFAIICFIIADLLLFNFDIIKFITMPTGSPEDLSARGFVNNEGPKTYEINR